MAQDQLGPSERSGAAPLAGQQLLRLPALTRSQPWGMSSNRHGEGIPDTGVQTTGGPEAFSMKGARTRRATREGCTWASLSTSETRPTAHLNGSIRTIKPSDENGGGKLGPWVRR